MESWRDTKYFSKDAFKAMFFQASPTAADDVQIMYEFHIFSVPDSLGWEKGKDFVLNPQIDYTASRIEQVTMFPNT